MSQPDVQPWQGARSIKRLDSSAEASRLHREYTRRMWDEIRAGGSFVLGAVPVMELLNAMELNFLLPVQYGSVIAAKQQFAKYQGVIESRGYFASLASYESLPLGYAFDPDPETAPYGGLPKPTAVVGINVQEPAVTELYASAFDAPLFMMDDPFRQQYGPLQWWDGPEWRDEAIIDFGVAELDRCVRFLESVTDKTYSETKTREYLRRADEMSRYYAKATALAFESPGPAPYTATDSYAEVGIFESHFGHEWALDHVRRMYEEVAERVADGAAAVPNERVRIMWAATPLWFNLGFYNAWEESHGAIFLEQLYLPRAERLIEADHSDALRAAFLRRHMKYSGPTPIAAAELYIQQCRRYRIDGVVLPARGVTRSEVACSRFIAAAMRKAGLKVLLLDFSPLDSAAWDEEEMRSIMTEFIESIEVSR